MYLELIWFHHDSKVTGNILLQQNFMQFDRNAVLWNAWSGHCITRTVINCADCIMTHSMKNAEKLCNCEIMYGKLEKSTTSCVLQ